MGVVSGVADLLFILDSPIAIELKRPDGKNGQSERQTKWQEQWERMGHGYFIFNDLQRLWSVLR